MIIYKLLEGRFIAVAEKEFIKKYPSQLVLMLVEWAVTLIILWERVIVIALPMSIVMLGLNKVMNGFPQFAGASSLLYLQCVFFPLAFIFNVMVFFKTVYDEFLGQSKGHSLPKEKFTRCYWAVNSLWKLFIVVGSAILFLVPGWFLGGRPTLYGLEQVIENQIASSYGYGERNFQIGSYQSATSNYKQAVFLEKYVLFWNDNHQMPIYYSALARSQMNESDYEAMYKNYRKSVDAYVRYRPEDAAGYAFTQYTLAMACSLTGRSEEELQYCRSAYDYFSALPEEEQNQNTAKIGIWLAHCCYERGDYETACELFDTNIPRYYDAIDWGVGDEPDAVLIALCYYFARLSFEKLPDAEKLAEYSEKYERFMFLRDYIDSEVAEWAAAFGWDE